jgi:hypothetical protein
LEPPWRRFPEFQDFRAGFVQAPRVKYKPADLSPTLHILGIPIEINGLLMVP